MFNKVDEFNKFSDDALRLLESSQTRYNNSFDSLYDIFGLYGVLWSISEKCIRLQYTRNPQDLLKIACYAFLAYNKLTKEVTK